jgi:DUF1680 family protein
MALVRLHRATGDARYLELARFMLDMRGPDGSEGSGAAYNQSHLPVVEQTEAIGHAVRATYMYSGMADVAAATGDPRYVAAIDRIWDDVVRRKLYVTGGIGARHDFESFGDPYELPNATAYSETCAAIGNVFWNHRLFLLHADARYIDVLERTLYNALLAGVSLDGMAFFYDNPLESDGTHSRSSWFGCACCPSNIARFLPSLPGYVYAIRGQTLYVNLFVAGTAEIEMGAGRSVSLTQETLYPWDGAVRLKVEGDPPEGFTLNVRIPGWARNQALPGDLYRFLDNVDEPAALRVNGEPQELGVERGYASLPGIRSGDIIDLRLPLPVRRLVAHEKVADARGRVALQRGPLVYCLEHADNPHIPVRDLALSDDAPLTTEFVPDLLGGVVVVRGHALGGAPGGAVDPPQAGLRFTAIPYYAWANRGPGEMSVWIGRQGGHARSHWQSGRH